MSTADSSMESITKAGNLRSDPTVTKKSGMSYATFSFYDSELRADGEAVMRSPAVIVYVVAFGGIADFVENMVRNGYTVIVTGTCKGPEEGEGQSTANKVSVNMVAESIQIVNVPKYASRVPQPLKKSEGAARREEYEANGGFRKKEPVLQSWEDEDVVEGGNE